MWARLTRPRRRPVRGSTTGMDGAPRTPIFRTATSRVSPGVTVSAERRHVECGEARHGLPLFAGQPAEVGQGDDADEAAVVVHHGEIGVGAVAQVGQQHIERRLLAHHLRRRVECVENGKAGEHVAVRAVFHPLAPAAEPPAVQRIRLEAPRDEIGDDRGEHEREDDGVVVGHLEHQEDSGDRGGRGRGYDRSHAHQRVRLRPEAQMGEQLGEHHAERTAGRRPDEERRGEETARSAGVERDRCGHDAAECQQCQRRRRHPAEELEMHRQMAVAHETPPGEQHEDADEEAADPG